MTTVTSLNNASGTVALEFGAGSAAGSISIMGTIGGSNTTTLIGTVVGSFEGYFQGTHATRSGAVTLTAGDVSGAVSSGNIFNLLDYGPPVLVDGFPDWGPALMTCINDVINGSGNNGGKGKAVYIPAGIYPLISAVAVTSTGSGSANLTIFGDGPDASILQVEHCGVALSINLSSYPFNTCAIRNIGFNSVVGTVNEGVLTPFTWVTQTPGGYGNMSGTISYLSEAALRLALPASGEGAAGTGSYITMLLEDIKIFGGGSLNPNQLFNSFRNGIQLWGGNAVRFHRVAFAGPSLGYSGLSTYAVNAVELTSSVEVHIDSCNLINADSAIAIMDGGCQGIYLRDSTVVNANYVFANAASVCSNASVGVTVSSVSADNRTLTITGASSALGQNGLDNNLPAIAYNMSAPAYFSTSPTNPTVVQSVVPSIGNPTGGTIPNISACGTGTIVMSNAATATIIPGAVVDFYYARPIGAGGIALTLVNTEIMCFLGCMSLSFWSGMRIIGNDITRSPSGPSSSGTSPYTQFRFSDVSGAIIMGNNILPQVGDGTATTETCFTLDFAHTDANAYIITGNTIGPFNTVLDIGTNVFQVQFSGNFVDASNANLTGGGPLFVDSNTTAGFNQISYTNNNFTSNTATLVNFNPTLVEANLPTTRPSAHGLLYSTSNTGGTVLVS